MKEEYKELLLRDLYARIPYGVKVYNEPYTFDLDNFEFSSTISETILEIIKEGWKPYLRPISSMTEDEKKELGNFVAASMFASQDKNPLFQLTREALYGDFFNKHYLDYRGLIPMGLALEAPKNMYKFD